MARYLTNLWKAFLGKNPYQDDLDELSEKYEKTAKHVKCLQDLYCHVVDKMEEDSRMLTSSQTLIENLRERVREKDAELERQGTDYRERMEQMKSGYQQQIGEYNIAIEEMKKELAEKSGQVEKLQAAGKKTKNRTSHGHRTGNKDASAEA